MVVNPYFTLSKADSVISGQVLSVLPVPLVPDGRTICRNQADPSRTSGHRDLHTGYQRNRTAPRGVQAQDQNPDGAAVGRDCSDAVLGTTRLRSDHYAQSGRMAEPDPETRR